MLLRNPVVEVIIIELFRKQDITNSMRDRWYKLSGSEGSIDGVSKMPSSYTRESLPRTDRKLAAKFGYQSYTVHEPTIDHAMQIEGTHI